jgi:hypothetical protein
MQSRDNRGGLQKMRLKPPITFEEALTWLTAQAVGAWGVEETDELKASLTPMAQNMVAISAAEVPADTEPLLI